MCMCRQHQSLLNLHLRAPQKQRFLVARDSCSPGKALINLFICNPVGLRGIYVSVIVHHIRNYVPSTNVANWHSAILSVTIKCNCKKHTVLSLRYRHLAVSFCQLRCRPHTLMYTDAESE